MGVRHVQVAAQQGKYLAQVLKDNPLVLQPGPNGPTVRGVTPAVILCDEIADCVYAEQLCNLHRVLQLSKHYTCLIDMSVVIAKVM